MTGTRLSDLAVSVESRLPRLVDAACASIFDRIPAYRDGRVVPAADLRKSVEHNLRSLITAIGDPRASLDLRAPQETGRRRAHQGMPLPEVLQAYRLSFATLWDALVEQARLSRPPTAVDTLLTAASMIWQLTDEHALALTEGFRAATAELLLAQQRRRSALVEALLTGHPGPVGSQWEAAALLGLPPDGQVVVVAADTRGLAEESLPDIERRLAASGIVSGWRLTPAQQLGVVSLRPDQLDIVLAVLREAVSARTGVSPPYRSLGDTPRALHLAQAALTAIPVGVSEVRLFSPSPLAALMVCEPDEGRRLADKILGAVLGLPTEERAKLLDTFNAYLDNAGSAERAAGVVHCHPNTIRYRLRRLQEITGRSLSDPRDIAELASAAYALRLGSATELWRGRRPAAVTGVNGRRAPEHAARRDPTPLASRPTMRPQHREGRP